MLARLHTHYRLRRKIRRAPRMGEKELLMVPVLLAGGTAIDVGANKGLYAMMMSAYADKVVALEPNPIFARVLASLPANCEFHAAAASDRSGTMMLNVPVSTGQGDHPNVGSLEKFDDRQSREIEVPVLPLDRFADEVDVKLVKIDVERHELNVLAGARRLLEKHRPAIIIEALTAAAVEATVAALEPYDFAPLRLVQGVLRPLCADDEPGYHERNLIFLPR